MKEEAFLEALAYIKARVEQELENLLPEDPSPGGRVVSAMRYSLLSGGKRLRPALCWWGAEAVGGRGEDFLLFACGLECLHTYSLIHDDLPAMDDDDLRRGQPTCHRAFDEATAILAGDGLQALAFELFSHPELLKKTAAERLLQALHLVAQAAGIHGMVGGQMADLLAEGKSVPLKTVEYIHAHKTAALITASVVSGGLLAGASPQEKESLWKYGEAVGLAFQIVDGLLDLTGEEKTLGKTVGADLKKKKATYPAVAGVEEARRQAQKLIEQALCALKPLGERAEPLRALARFVLSRQN